MAKRRQTGAAEVTEASATVHKKPARVYGRGSKGKARESSVVQIAQLDLYSGEETSTLNCGPSGQQPPDSDPHAISLTSCWLGSDGDRPFGLIGDGWTTAPHSSERDNHTQSDDELLPPPEKEKGVELIGDLLATSDRSHSISVGREETNPNGDVEVTHSRSSRNLNQLLGDLFSSPALSSRDDAGADNSPQTDLTSPPSPIRSRIPLIGTDWSSVVPSDKVSDALQSLRSSQSQEPNTTQDTLGADWSSWADPRISPSPEDADKASSNQPCNIAPDRGSSPSREVVPRRSVKPNKPAPESTLNNSCLEPHPGESSSSTTPDLNRKPAEGKRWTRHDKRNADVAAPRMQRESPMALGNIPFSSENKVKTGTLHDTNSPPLVRKPEASPQIRSARARLPQPRTTKMSTEKKTPEGIAGRVPQSPDIQVRDSQSNSGDVPQMPGGPVKSRVQGAQMDRPMEPKKKKPRQIAKKPFDPNAPLIMPNEAPRKRRQRNARNTAKHSRNTKSKTIKEPPGRSKAKKTSAKVANKTPLGMTKTNGRRLIADRHTDVACVEILDFTDMTLGSCDLQQQDHGERDAKKDVIRAEIRVSLSPSNAPFEPRPTRSTKDAFGANIETDARTKRQCEPDQAVESVISMKQGEAAMCQEASEEPVDDMNIVGGDDGMRGYTSDEPGDDDGSEFIPDRGQLKPACEPMPSEPIQQGSLKVISVSSDSSSNQSSNEKPSSFCEGELLPSPETNSETLPVSPEVAPPSPVLDQPVAPTQPLGPPNAGRSGGTRTTPPLSPRHRPTGTSRQAQTPLLECRPSSEIITVVDPPREPASPELGITTRNQTETLNRDVSRTPRCKTGYMSPNLTTEPTARTPNSERVTWKLQNGGFILAEGPVSHKVSHSGTSPTGFLGHGLRRARKREDDFRVIETPRKRVKFSDKLSPSERFIRQRPVGAGRHGAYAGLFQCGLSNPSLPRDFIQSSPIGDGDLGSSRQEDIVPAHGKPESTRFANNFKEDLKERFHINGGTASGSGRRNERLAGIRFPQLNRPKTPVGQPNVLIEAVDDMIRMLMDQLDSRAANVERVAQLFMRNGRQVIATLEEHHRKDREAMIKKHEVIRVAYVQRCERVAAGIRTVRHDWQADDLYDDSLREWKDQRESATKDAHAESKRIRDALEAAMKGARKVLSGRSWSS